jgi:hypothetical protein
MAKPQVEVIDNPSIKESYANKVIATSFDGGAVVVTLGTTRFVPEYVAERPKESGPPPVHVTIRLAISPAGAVELINALNATLKTLSQIQQQTGASKAN